MEIILIDALDYNKVDELLKQTITNEKERKEFLEQIKNIEKARRSEIVSSAGRLSRFSGNVLEIVDKSSQKSLQQNANYAKNIMNIGHTSITDHDYLVFAIKDVSVLIEQTIIDERFASFTIKSRREADHSTAGYYIPDFHDKNGNLLPNNAQLQEEYQKYINSLFSTYSEMIDNGVIKEDARYILPYCFNSNIIMGVDAHTLRDMIVKFTKTKYANITELREFGEKLYEIAKENCPYIIDSIDKVEKEETSKVDEFLAENIKAEDYSVQDKPKLLNASANIDDTILISAIMRRYQYDYDKAKQVYEIACKQNPNFPKELMQKIAFEDDKLELTQANFQFQIPLSYAVLTHLTRHRTHDILNPTFVPNCDLLQYKTPPKIAKNEQLNKKFQEVFALNKAMYDHFKDDYNVRDEDLVYFTLSGNLVNTVTNMDGKTVEHILRLRECNKAQWETRDMANGIHKEIAKLPNSENFTSILGATCTTKGICNEGKECCGKVYTLKNNKMPKKNEN